MVSPMKTMISAGIAVAMLAAVVPTVAQADSTTRADGSFDVAQNWNHGHRGPGWNNGPGWHGKRPVYRHPGWRGAGYYHRPGYRGTYYYNDYNSALAAGVFGLAAGAIIGGAVANNNQNQANAYVSYCSQRYRSFNPATGTYTGYDGLQHRCIAPQ